MGTMESKEPRLTLIDSLLDAYNENIKLYKRFGEFCYKERADNFMEILKQHFSTQQTQCHEM